MEKCISCLPNGTASQHEYARFLKQNDIKRVWFRENDKKDWKVTTLESFEVIKKKHKKNKNFEFVLSSEYKF